jgi:hypothetical protein
VAYAETYQVTVGEPASAVKALDKAEGYPAKALTAKSLGVTTRQKIKSMEKKLEYLKLRPEENDLSTQEMYEAITTELSDLIKRMESDDMAQKMEGSE